MTITLNESESKHYIESLDIMKAIADIEECIETLEDVRMRITPPELRIDNSRYVMPYTEAEKIITARIQILKNVLDKITGKYKTRQS